MTIAIGERLPNVTFHVATADGPAPKTTDELFKGKTIALFGVPGAFTPTCHRNHLPGFVAKGDAIKAKGVDAIYCTSVNDAFVMKAWGDASGATGAVEMLADGSGAFAKGIGLSLDLSERGLGLRSQRYSMIVKDGVVTALNIEETPGTAEVSGAEALYAML